MNITKKIFKLFFGESKQGNYNPETSINKTKNAFVSFIIPCRNEERTIEECIIAIIKDGYKKKEIIVIDDESTDSTPKILKSLKKRYPSIIRILKNKKRIGPGPSKNRGIYASKGKFLILMDAHSIINKKEFVKSYLKHFSDPKVGAVAGGRSFIPVHYMDQVLFYAGGLRPWREMGFQFLDTPNSAFRRDVFIEIGGIDTNLTWGSDLSNTCKILSKGYEISVCPEASITIDHGKTKNRKVDFIRKPFFYGTAMSYVVPKYPRIMWKRQVDIKIIFGGTVNLLALIFSAIFPRFFFIPIITIGIARLHSLALAIYERAPLKYILGMPVILTISEISYALGFFYGNIRRLLRLRNIRY